MFFGTIVKVEEKKAKATLIESDVKLSQAVLDPSSQKHEEPVCLLAEVGGKSFILAVLDPSQSWQCPLDLMLAAGTEVKFFLRGKGTIHLTGYEFLDDDSDIEFSMSSDDEENEQNLDEAEPQHATKKLKLNDSNAKTNGVKQGASKIKASGDDAAMDEDDSDDEDLSFGSDDDSDEGDDSDDSDDDDDDDEDSLDLDAVSDDDDEKDEADYSD